MSTSIYSHAHSISAAASDPLTIFRTWVDQHQCPENNSDIEEYLEGLYSQLSTPGWELLARVLVRHERERAEAEDRRWEEEEQRVREEEEQRIRAEAERARAAERAKRAEAAEARAPGRGGNGIVVEQRRLSLIEAPPSIDEAPAPKKDKGKKKRKPDDISDSEVEALDHLKPAAASKAETTVDARKARAWAIWEATKTCDRCASWFVEVRECIFADPDDVACIACAQAQAGCYFGGASFAGKRREERSGMFAEDKKDKEKPVTAPSSRPNKRARLDDASKSFKDLVGDFASVPRAARSHVEKLAGQSKVRGALESAAARAETLTSQMDILSFELSCVEALHEELMTAAAQNGFTARTAELAGAVGVAGPSRAGRS
ncbi:hypothetical protein EVJ58_g3956 [Rhodofomes roseus]|uniref:Uncharacterized protein n=1 Tax=Rhodofomes roseus TaxID=34475 RepID=A0A4Y9YMT8_9APHY|nr:hypothetical protein EVJ58_g3956 [Rhodofomes roseus]